MVFCKDCKHYAIMLEQNNFSKDDVPKEIDICYKTYSMKKTFDPVNGEYNLFIKPEICRIKNINLDCKDYHHTTEKYPRIFKQLANGKLEIYG